MGRRPSATIDHPLQTWMSERHLNTGQVVELLAGIGRTTSIRYVRHIITGYRRPSWEFAKSISRITAWTVTAEDLMNYRRPSLRTRAA